MSNTSIILFDMFLFCSCRGWNIGFHGRRVDTKGERERNEAKHTTHTNRSDLSLCKSPKIYAVQSFTKKCVHKYLRFPDNSASEIAT
jgi:hypothetical protein